MFNTSFRHSLAFLVSILFLQMSLAVQAAPRRKKNPTSVPPAVVPAPQPIDPYAMAKKDLSEDWYVLYRIIDRLARANQLDEHPWRITISPEYEVNAFATDGNLIAVYNGILDQLGSDSSAIACVVAHEMGHHSKRHIALGKAEQVALQKKLQQEAQEEAVAEIERAQQPTGGDVILGILGAVSAGLSNNSSTAYTTAAQIEKAKAQRVQEAQVRTQEIFVEKEQKFKQESAANVRKQEFEADEVGYQYMAKAGFDAQGCIRAMEVLARTEGAEFDTDHPAVPKRIERFKQLMAENPPQALAERGKFYLQSSRIPLSYELSKDGESLRINSNHGSSAADDLDRQFGK
jgi:predicted Zn-dependent protease